MVTKNKKQGRGRELPAPTLLLGYYKHHGLPPTIIRRPMSLLLPELL
jgi:hypothetical protein